MRKGTHVRPHRRTSVKHRKFTAGRGDTKSYSGIYYKGINTLSIPHSDEVRFYDVGGRFIIYTYIKETRGNSWKQVRVGTHVKNTQKPSETIGKLIQSYYPSAKPIFLFQSLSYHRGESNKVSNYGTKPYTLQYTKRIPIKTYKLEYPIRSNRKNDLGNVITSVTTYKWIYVELNWRPTDTGTKLFITSKTKYPNYQDVIHFQSQEFDESQSKEAIALFYEQVEIAKKRR